VRRCQRSRMEELIRAELYLSLYLAVSLSFIYVFFSFYPTTGFSPPAQLFFFSFYPTTGLNPPVQLFFFSPLLREYMSEINRVSYLDATSAVVMYGLNDCGECGLDEGSGVDFRSVDPVGFVVSYSGVAVEIGGVDTLVTRDW